MKKTVTVFLLLMISIYSNAQRIPLGENIESIVKELTETKQQFNVDDSYGFSVITFETKVYKQHYFFDNTGMCDQVAFIPFTETLLDGMVKSLGIKKNKPKREKLDLGNFVATLEVALEFPDENLPTIFYRLVDY